MREDMNSFNKTNGPVPITEILSLFIQGPICIIGFCLNVINFSVFVKRKYFAAPYVLLSALSLADALTLLLYSTECLAKCQHLSFCRQPYIQVSAYVLAVYVKVPLSNITETISSIITVALATERYLAMKHYNFRKIYFTVKNTRVFVISISVFSTIFNTPFFFTTTIKIVWENITSTKENVPVAYSTLTSMMNSSFYSVHSWTRAVGIQMLPLLYLCICNSLLLTLICQHNKRLENIRSSYSISPDYKSSSYVACDSPLSIQTSQSSIRERKQIAQNKLTVLLSIVIFLYLIGQIPSSLAYFNIYRHLGSCDPVKYAPECPNYDLYRTVTLIMMLFCYTINFFVYFFLNSHFRKSLYDCFDKLFSIELRTTFKVDKNTCCSFNAAMTKERNNSLVIQSSASNNVINLTIPNLNTPLNSFPRSSSSKPLILAPIIEHSKEDFSTNCLETFEIESINLQNNIFLDINDTGKSSIYKAYPILVPIALSESLSSESINIC